MATSRYLLTAVSLLLSAGSMAESERRQISSGEENQIVIDGTIEDRGWQNVSATPLNYVTQPYNNTKPPVETVAYMREDGKALYVAFHARVDDITTLRASQRNRDELGNDDFVAVKLDTFGDARKAFMFSVNPYGAQSDLIHNEHANTASYSWDATWESAATITEEGYTVEMRIPLSSLQYQDIEGQPLNWGVELIRYHGADVIYRIAHVPTDRNLACQLCQLEGVSLFSHREKQDTINIITEYTAGWQRNRPNTEWQHSDDQNVGVTARWKVTPSSQILATVNPDFSQVEADASALNINEPFTLYFEERRAFFTEASETFDSHSDLIYTRNIASPRWGIKNTNQIGDHNLSVLLAEDTATTILIPGTLSSSVSTLDESSLQGALRYRYAVNNDASVGVTATTREADIYHNRVFSVDGKYRVTDTGTLYYQDSFSDTQYPQAITDEYCYTSGCSNSEAYQARSDDAFSGRHTMIRYTEEQENIYLWLSRDIIDKDYRADLGFVTEVGLTFDQLYGYYRWYNEDGWWSAAWLGSSNEYKTSEDDATLLEKNRIFAGIQGPWQSHLEVGMHKSSRIGFRDEMSQLNIQGNARSFSTDGWDITLSSSPTKWLDSELYWLHADAIDYTGQRQGKEDYITLNNTLRLSQSLELGINLWHNPFTVEGEELYTASIADIRMTYNPSNRHQLKVAAIHYLLDRNADAYGFAVEEKYRDWELQVIYTYELNNVTRFYAGIASLDYKTGGMQSMRPTDQSAFIKFSYGFNL